MQFAINGHGFEVLEKYRVKKELSRGGQLTSRIKSGKPLYHFKIASLQDGNVYDAKFPSSINTPNAQIEIVQLGTFSFQGNIVQMVDYLSDLHERSKCKYQLIKDELTGGYELINNFSQDGNNVIMLDANTGGSMLSQLSASPTDDDFHRLFMGLMQSGSLHRNQAKILYQWRREK